MIYILGMLVARFNMMYQNAELGPDVQYEHILTGPVSRDVKLLEPHAAIS